MVAGLALALTLVVDAATETVGEAELRDVFAVSVVLALAEASGLALEVRAAEGWLVGGADACAAAARPVGGGGAALQGAAPQGFPRYMLEHSVVSSVGQVDGGSDDQRCINLGCGSGSWPTATHLNRGHSGGPRLPMVRFGGAAGARLLGEELWLHWWQQCRPAAICGVQRKGLAAVLVQMSWGAEPSSRSDLRWAGIFWLAAVSSTGAVVTGHACLWPTRRRYDNQRMAAP
jgi:hypothetical protein